MRQRPACRSAKHLLRVQSSEHSQTRRRHAYDVRMDPQAVDCITVPHRRSACLTESHHALQINVTLLEAHVDSNIAIKHKPWQTIGYGNPDSLLDC